MSSDGNWRGSGQRQAEPAAPAAEGSPPPAVPSRPEGDHRLLVTRRLFLTLIPASYFTVKTASAANASVPPPSLRVVAHEDDDLLFLSPDLLHAVQAGGS